MNGDLLTVDPNGLRTKELLIRIDERVSLLQGRVDELAERIRLLEESQRRINGEQRVVRERNAEVDDFLREMRQFQLVLMEWKGGVAKQVGLVGLIGGAIPAAVTLALLFMKGVLP